MKKAFTLIELIATIVILGVVTSIVSILIMNVIRNVKDSARKRSIDNYGRIIETSMAEYQSQYLKYPDSIDQLEIEYVGSVIECDIRRINSDKTIYLSECKVNGKKVLDKDTEDGYYHYGTLVLTNEEYVDKLGKNIELALKDYYKENNKYPVNYRLLNLPKLDKDVICNSQINYDGSIYLNNCSVDGEKVGNYTYGEIVYPLATQFLLSKTNSKSITTYTEGDTHEMYTFDHAAAAQTPVLTDYRYIGSNPYNYVSFNNELWRIIGIFEIENESGEMEKRVKIIRNENLPQTMKWDDNNVNEWSTATLQTYLNGDYYNSLDSESKKFVKDTKWYLGAVPYFVLNPGNSIYNAERGNNTYTGDDIKRSINFVEKIGLIYPSDYIYTYALGVDNVCYSNASKCQTGYDAIPSNGWMFNLFDGKTQNTISPHANWPDYISFVSNNGSFYYGGYLPPISSWAVKSTMYLSSKVKIKSGDGTVDNAYKLTL